MRQEISLIAAPTAMSPGGYVRVAFAKRDIPKTPRAGLEAVRDGRIWRIRVDWDCAEPAYAIGDDVDGFVDAVAVLAPTTPDAQWMTMGAPDKAVEGALWRADRRELIGIRAEGLGTVERRAVPDGWTANGTWKAGAWQVEFELDHFAVLDSDTRLALAIWQGGQGDRAGLKSVAPGWVELE